MKQNISQVMWVALAIMLFNLSSCSGKHESQGKKIGKTLDKVENSVEKKFDHGREIAKKSKENIEKKAHELHEKSKEKAHELIDKS